MDIGFALKKFISFFVEPYGMVLSIFIIGFYFLFVNKIAKTKLFLVFAFGLMFLFSYPPFSNYLVSSLENQYPKYDYKQKVKYIHVLGGGHTTDISQPISSQIGSASIKRDIEGIIIHKHINGSKIIFTGYSANTNISTAKMNTSLAIALDVNPDDIILNKKPKDTKEEAIFTKSLVGNEPFVLVTSATHMPRAMMLFKSLGLNPIPAPTDFHKSEFKGYLIAPDIYTFCNSQIAMHEYLGIAWSKIKSQLHALLG